MELTDLALHDPARAMITLRRLLRSPPLHFVLGGLLLFLVLDGPWKAAPAVEAVALTAEAREQLRASWTATMGRAPSAEEMQSLGRRELDDEVLFREALSNELHLHDPVVRQRLVLNMRFLGEDLEEQRALEQALAMDMHRNDLVVRRRLVQLMEFALADGAGNGEITVAELEAMYAQRREELREPARWRVLQVYFSGERRGAAAVDDARGALTALAVPVVDPAAAIALGDPFLGGHQLPLLSATQLESQFGPDFVNGLADCALQQWCAPVRSSFGAHAVLIEELQESRLPAIDEPDVRRRLESDVRRQRGERQLAEALGRLRSKYGVNG